MKKPPLSRHLCPLAVLSVTSNNKLTTCNLLHGAEIKPEESIGKEGKQKKKKKADKEEEKKKKKDAQSIPIWTADSICCDSFVLTSDSVSHFSSVDPSLSLSLSLFHTHKHTHTHTFSSLCVCLFIFSTPPPHSLPPSLSFSLHSLLSPPRSSPRLAPEQNEPPLHSGTLFLWQCEQASKSAGYCSANVWGQIPHSAWAKQSNKLNKPLTSILLC